MKNSYYEDKGTAKLTKTVGKGVIAIRVDAKRIDYFEKQYYNNTTQYYNNGMMYFENDTIEQYNNSISHADNKITDETWIMDNIFRNIKFVKKTG